MRTFETNKLEKVLKSRFFLSQTAEIYGGVSGFFDLGPVLFGIKQNLINEWRKHFVYYDKLYEIETSLLLPYSVLKASGHVDKFCDILILDSVTGQSYRADHFLEEYFEKLKQKESSEILQKEISKVLKTIDCIGCEEIDSLIDKYEILTPNNNKFSPSVKFNLMFETVFGYSGSNHKIFLRPETAQGQFLNFKKLYEFNNRKIPFGSATIGKAFRNEISPRSGLLRTREFEQAEIEFFVSPEKKDFSKFDEVKEIEINCMYDDKTTKIKLNDAVKQKIIDNETLGYFIGRTQIFLENLGFNSSFFRFRQHKKDEMAHYALDCWDCEIFSSFGWIECVGIADRSAYDLTCHTKGSGVELYFTEKCTPSITKKEWEVKIDKKFFIKQLKGDFESFRSSLQRLKSEEIESKKYQENNKQFIDFTFDEKEYKIEVTYNTHVINERKIVPDVIEPSFGINRILYILLEHSFTIRESEKSVLKIKPKLSHVKVVISYVCYNPKFKEEIGFLENQFLKKNITSEVNDRSCSIGRKYASCDEIGIPFFITFDNETLNDKCITIRERDTTEQVRLSIVKAPDAINSLIVGDMTWESLLVNNMKI